jgi:hypothetical protein
MVPPTAFLSNYEGDVKADYVLPIDVLPAAVRSATLTAGRDGSCRIGGLEMDAGTEHEIPPPVAMMGLITGYWVSQAVGAVALLGVADHLGNGPDARPNWREEAERPTLTGMQWRN